MKKFRTRRHRRQSRMVLRSHGKFKINHNAPFGRTGSKRGHKAQRKLRRRIEADAYAQEARFWAGKIKSADRLGHDRPVNRQAAGELGGLR